MRVCFGASLTPRCLLVAVLAMFLVAPLCEAGSIASDGVPYISAVSPNSMVPGGSDSTLTVTGFNFASDATVYWKGTTLTTTYVSTDSLTAIVPAALTVSGGTGWITVKNGSVVVKSNLAFVSVAHPISGLTVEQSPLNTGSEPLELAYGDFNNDGKLDLVVSNYGTGTFAVMLGNGDGTFQDPQTYSTAGNPFGLAVGDVNGDGNLDIVVGTADYTSGNVAVSLGNGDGTFQPPASLSSADYENLHPVLADFNHDGKLDILVSDYDSYGAQLYLGNGDGTFQSPTQVGSSSNYSFSLAVGDVNGDGNADVVMASNSGAEVGVYLGNGDGTFQSPTPAETSTSLDFVQLQDLNGDGKLDLIGCILGDTNIWVFLGNGDGTFQSPQTVTVASVYNFALGDLNGDGTLDIAASGYGVTQVFFSNGDGTFQAANSFPGGSFTYGPVIGNFANGATAAIAITDFSGNQGLLFEQTPDVSPSSVDFGSQGAGSTSAAQSITLTNPTSTSIAIASIGFAGANAGDFAQVNDCGTSLASGAWCTIQVTFTPGAQGARSASLSITDDAPSSPQSVALTGTGTAAPLVDLSSQSVVFADHHVGTAASSQQVTLTNSGSATLSLSAFAITGTNAADFAQTNDCGSSLAAAASCTITIDFTPSAAGTRAASLEITDGAADSPQHISLTGVGTQAQAQLSSTSIDLGSSSVGTPSATQQVTLTNGGNEALAITSISVTGTNAGDFAQTNNCGTSVPAGASCTIDLLMTPSAEGTRTALLNISDSANGSPQTISLTGTGSQGIGQLSTATLYFGASNVGIAATAQQVTFSNTGNASLTISGIAATGTNASDFAQTNNCGNSLAAGANCAITVTMTPLAGGDRSANLAVTSNGSGTQVVALSGTGRDFGINFMSSSQSVSPGGAAAYQVAITPVGGFNQAITIGCSGAPVQSVCSIQPASVTLNGTSLSTAVVTVTTTAKSFVPPNGMGGDFPRTKPLVWLISLCLLALILFSARRQGTSAFPLASTAALVFVVALLMLGMSACNAGISQPVSGGTPAGNYAVIVTATSGGLSHTSTAQLTVQ